MSNYRFGKRSKANLAEADLALQRLFEEVLRVHDCAVIEGRRSEEEQNRLYHAGRTKLKFPNSKHNSGNAPSLAVDVIPWPCNWEDRDSFYYFAGIVKGTAARLNIKIRWGGDWDGDNYFGDNLFNDLPHFELV